MIFIIIVQEKKLNVQGLMSIPPNDSNPQKYFKILNELNLALGPRN